MKITSETDMDTTNKNINEQTKLFHVAIASWLQVSRVRCELRDKGTDRRNMFHHFRTDHQQLGYAVVRVMTLKCRTRKWTSQKNACAQA